MHILVSNDDGVHAEGLKTLVLILRQAGHQVTVVAPDRNCSGASQALTLRQPIVVNWLDASTVSVQGTPADCIHLALNGLLEHRPDLIISGINSGENLGDDVWYSGTVAAASEGYLAGISALAISLVGAQYFDTAARIACDLIVQLSSLNTPFLLSVNVPDVPFDALSGMTVSKQGRRQVKARQSLVASKLCGQTAYWIDAPMSPTPDSCRQGYDFGDIQSGYVTVTPLNIDRTDQAQCELLTEYCVLKQAAEV